MIVYVEGVDVNGNLLFYAIGTVNSGRVRAESFLEDHTEPVVTTFILSGPLVNHEELI